MQTVFVWMIWFHWRNRWRKWPCCSAVRWWWWRWWNTLHRCILLLVLTLQMLTSSCRPKWPSLLSTGFKEATVASHGHSLSLIFHLTLLFPPLSFDFYYFMYLKAVDMIILESEVKTVNKSWKHFWKPNKQVLNCLFWSSKQVFPKFLGFFE